MPSFGRWRRQVQAGRAPFAHGFSLYSPSGWQPVNRARGIPRIMHRRVRDRAHPRAGPAPHHIDAAIPP